MNLNGLYTEKKLQKVVGGEMCDMNNYNTSD